MSNIIKTNYIFPTVVNEFTYKASDELINVIKNESLNVTELGYFNISKDINLQNRKEYKDLADKILHSTKDVCDMYGYTFSSMEITNMWLNLSKDQSYHSPHTHSNNNFSGVWYPLEFTDIPIVFIDPRSQTDMWSPKKGVPNELSATQIAFSNKKDSGFIFPSWLKHYVPSSKSSRMSLSWNVLIRGEYGQTDTLQNANI